MNAVTISVIIQFAALAVIAGIGICVVFAIFEMREVYAEQREKFLRAVAAVEEFHKLQPAFIAVLERIQSDGHALQKIARQIEVSVAAFRTGIRGPVTLIPPEPKSEDPETRLSTLKEWISTNEVTIELLPGDVLSIGTRDHDEKITIPLHDLIPSD